MYSEILPPIIEKHKILEANKRSVCQLLDLFCKTTDNKPKSYRCTAKSHATLFPKKIIPLYLEDLKFLITRCCWRVAKIYSLYTFKQARFKREFVLMNQKCRQNAKNANEKDFFKLMNNANFEFDCRNNANNAKFELIIDEINEITYIKKYYNLFDNKAPNFVNSDVLEQQIKHDFQQEIANVRYYDLRRSPKINWIKNQNSEDLDALEASRKEKKSKKRKLTKDVEAKLDDAFKHKKIKTNIEFDQNKCNSIKLIVVKGDTMIDVTSGFINVKMLMFSKVSLKSFVYDLIDVSYFPTKKVEMIYDQYYIIKIPSLFKCNRYR